MKDETQADQLFNGMKKKEIIAFNHNHGETEKMMKEISDKLYSENRLTSLSDLEGLKKLITEYKSVLENIGATIQEKTNFEENRHFIERNNEYNETAVNTLKTSLKVVKDRIKTREAEQLNELPKTFKTGYRPEQLKELRKALIGEGFICNSISENDFVYIFSEQPITRDVQPIKWKVLRGLTALREFIALVTGDPVVHTKQVERCFIDIKNKPCRVPKPKKREYSQHYKYFETILKQI